jgi:hypothetical protein
MLVYYYVGSFMYDATMAMVAKKGLHLTQEDQHAQGYIPMVDR